MIINQKTLSIPPYISTSWNNVLSIHAELQDTSLVLIVDLKQGGRIEIPRLTKEALEAVFTFHARYLEEIPSSGQVAPKNTMTVGFAQLPEGMEGLLQHNEEQANADPLPEEVLNKIRSLSSAMGMDRLMPKPEPHCNCPFCQVSRAMHDLQNTALSEKEDEVSDADLTFRTWDIEQIAEKLYSVKNPLDKQECYQVYLGEPVGCTCGQPHCDHIHSVLMSH